MIKIMLKVDVSFCEANLRGLYSFHIEESIN